MTSAKHGPKWHLYIALAVAVGLVIAFWPRSPEPPRTEPKAESVPEPKKAEPSPSGDQPVITKEVPKEPPPLARPDAGEPEAKKEPPPPPPPITDTSPLVGVDARDMTEADRSSLKLPEKLKGGVVILKIDPTSPAAEAHLEPNDVISQAHLTQVKSFDDLKRAIGDREQTTIRVYRNGRPFDVVLHKPFKPQ
jgi:hypothetical protein